MSETSQQPPAFPLNPSVADPAAAPVDPAPVDPAPAPTETPAAAPSAVSEPAPAPSKPAADVGDVISYQTDPEDDATLTRGLVVGTVEGAEHRDEGLLVVPLADAFYVPLDAVKD